MTFFVAGKPAPKGSKVMGRTKDGRMFMRESASSSLRPWMKAIRVEAAKHFKEPSQSSVWLYMDFWMPRGKTVKRELHTVKPDLDKLQRAVMDALTGIVYVDDAQVIGADSFKAYPTYRQPEPGVRIGVEIDGLT